MLQHLIIIVDDTSTSYCHYSVPKVQQNLIPLDVLKRGVLFAMKENLQIQYLYPDYELPPEYHDVIESMYHCKIKSSALSKDAHVIVFNDLQSLIDFKDFNPKRAYLLRISKNELFSKYKDIGQTLQKGLNLNLVITDVESFEEKDYNEYKTVLTSFKDVVEKTLLSGKGVSTNILTDRLVLENMNNCEAGVKSIALAPDGNFYICPAFYYNQDEHISIGNVFDGLDIKNPQLYRLAHSPLCRRCDAYQCKRCVWLNRKLTYEVNTPSRQQCILSHIERNASRELLLDLQENKLLLNKEIKEIDYIDPFDTFQG